MILVVIIFLMTIFLSINLNLQKYLFFIIFQKKKLWQKLQDEEWKITMTAINEIVDLSMIALRHMGLPLLEKLAIKFGEFAFMEFRLYFFWVPISTFCLILCLCHAILMEKHK